MRAHFQSSLPKTLLILLSLLVGPMVCAQDKMIYKGDTVNQLDRNGKRHGKWVQTFPESKKIRYIGTFEHGTPSDTFRYYYRNEQLKAVNLFEDNGRVARNISFHPNGKVMAEGKFVEKKKDSIWRFYDQEGVLSAIKNFRHGERYGRSIVFFRNKDTARIEHYRDSTLHGPFKYFYRNGKVKAIGRFEHGLRADSLMRFHRNGQLHLKGTHKTGNRHGEWVYYGEDGKLERRVFYKKGEVQKILGPDGKVIQKGTPLDTNGVTPLNPQEKREGPRIRREDEQRRGRRRRPDTRGP